MFFFKINIIIMIAMLYKDLKHIIQPYYLIIRNVGMLTSVSYHPHI